MNTPTFHRSVTCERETAVRPAPIRDGPWAVVGPSRSIRWNLMELMELMDGPWLVADAPPAPVLNMARAAAGARLAATFR